MILSAQTIRDRQQAWWARDNKQLIIQPFVEREVAHGMSYGLSAAGYDIRIGKIDRPGYVFEGDKPGGNKTLQQGAAQSMTLQPGGFVLLSSFEWLCIPFDIVAKVHDKSTLARQGLALQNTVLEPGWHGYITLELSNHGPEPITIRVGQPIAQVLFELLDMPTEQPYKGKYQNQGSNPTAAQFEK